MGIYFKFIPQKSDYSRTNYYFNVEEQFIILKYQKGDTVIVKNDGIYFEEFKVKEENTKIITFPEIINRCNETNCNQALEYIRLFSVDKNNTIKIELLKQYGKEREDDISYLYPDWYYLNENKWDYEIADLKTYLTDFDIIIKKWMHLLSDIVCQIYNLTQHLKDELRKINQHENIGSPITIRAIKSSILFLEFNYLESLSNFIANLIIEINKKTEGAPEVKQSLSNEEINKVNEEAKFTSIEAKISLFPQYLAKILGKSYRLDRSGEGWLKFKMIKHKRDSLTHTKMVDEDRYINLSIDYIRPTVEIKDLDLFIGFEVLYWYNSQIDQLFNLVNINHKIFDMGMGLNDNFSFYHLFSTLLEFSDYSSKQLNKKFTFTIVKQWKR